MKFSPGSDNFERWKQAVEKYCPSLKKEMNRLRALYQGAIDKKGEKLTCVENFAVIAVHSPESIAVKGSEFTACRCHVAWSGDDFQVNPITTITRKKKKQPEVTQVVKKKKKQPIEKIVIKKKKHRIDS